MRRTMLLGATVVLVAGLMVVVAPVASAAVTSSVDTGVLTITSDEDGDLIIVECVGGNVSVNEADPDTGAAPCGEITSVAVTAGGGADTVDLLSMRDGPDAFPALTSTSIDLGHGNDFAVGSHAPDTIVGGPGEDEIHANLLQGDDVDGGDGNDVLVSHIRADVSILDAAFTFETATVAFVSIEAVWVGGNQHPQTFDASEFSGSLFALGAGGDDRLIGGTGPNELNGQNGDDVMVGGPEDDWLRGTAGDDVLRGKAGNDTIYAKNGNDVLRGGPDDDVLDGGQGLDTCSGGGGADSVVGCE
ncbi:MAG: calcium-binding protein [Actinomycetota bacterium]